MLMNNLKLNVSSWKEFTFSRVFDIKKGFYNKKPEHNSRQKGKIPFIGASDKEHGITDHLTLSEIESSSKTGEGKNANIKEKIFPANAVCVTNNGSVGYAYYMDRPFTCSHDVNPLYRIDGDFNKYTGLFVATVIMKDRYRWGYGRKWRPIRMVDSVIKLPVKTDAHESPILDIQHVFSDEGYIPDWDFMENYIKAMHPELPVTRNEITSNRLNIASWGKFCLNQLDIEIYKSKSYVKADCNIYDYPQPDSVPFISRTQYNNTVDGWMVPEEDDSLEEGNALTIGDTTATIAYQSKPFVTGEHIIVIRAKWLNKYTGLFLKTILDQEKFRYGYGRAFTIDLVNNTELILPVDEFGNPDWKFMEEYIKLLPNGDLI